MDEVVVGGEGSLSARLLHVMMTERGGRSTLVPLEPSAMAAAVVRHRPHLVLCDHGMAGDPDPADLVGVVHAALPATRVVVVTAEQRPERVSRVVAAGASGYLHKSGGVEALFRALERVCAGETVVSVPRRAAQDGRDDDHADVLRLAAALTCRERECLALLVDGITTDVMVERLGISPLTVRSHVQSVLYKLGVHSRLEAASLAVRHGLLPDAVGSRAG